MTGNYYILSIIATANLPLNLQPIPANDPQAQERRQNTKHQRHNPPSLKPIRQPPRIRIFAAQIRQIHRIPRRIALRRHIRISAALQMVLRNFTCELGLDVEWGLDDSGNEPRGNVPLDVAVEEPDTRVVGAEAEDGVAVGVDEDGVATHGRCGEVRGSGGVVEAGFVLAAVDDLEGVAVEMERVSEGELAMSLRLGGCSRRVTWGVILTFPDHHCLG